MVAVTRLGLILWENEATGSRKVLKYLPDLRDRTQISKIVKMTEKPKNPKFAVYRVGGMGVALLIIKCNQKEG